MYMPKFGTNLYQYLFEPNDSITLTGIKDEANASLKYCMPNISDYKLEVENNETSVTLTIWANTTRIFSLRISSYKYKYNMAKQINYSLRDFGGVRSELLNFVKQYYPDLMSDFNDASIGMMLLELNAAVADQLAYNTDRMFQELNWTMPKRDVTF